MLLLKLCLFVSSNSNNKEDAAGLPSSSSSSSRTAEAAEETEEVETKADATRMRTAVAEETTADVIDSGIVALINAYFSAYVIFNFDHCEHDSIPRYFDNVMHLID